MNSLQTRHIIRLSDQILHDFEFWGGANFEFGAPNLTAPRTFGRDFRYLFSGPH